jgi:hypothetical protein
MNISAELLHHISPVLYHLLLEQGETNAPRDFYTTKSGSIPSK